MASAEDWPKLRKRLTRPYRLVEDPSALENPEAALQAAQEAWKAKVEEKIENFKSLDFEARREVINGVLQKTHPERNRLRYDPRFPNMNGTKRCWVNYLDSVRCLNENSPKACAKYVRTMNAYCPDEWVDSWNEQLKNNLFPGIIVKPINKQKLARRLDLPKGAPIPSFLTPQ